MIGGGGDDDGGMPEEKSFEHKIMGQIYVGRKANSSSYNVVGLWLLFIWLYKTFPIQFANLLDDLKYVNDCVTDSRRNSKNVSYIFVLTLTYQHYINNSPLNFFLITKPI